jgi:hypothetical protein
MAISVLASIFADAARVIVNLGSVGQHFTGVGDPKFSGENLAADLTSMSASGLMGLGLISRWAGRAAVQPYWIKSMIDGGARLNEGDIILSAITVVEVLELTTGFGPPHEGDDLKTGSEQFTKVYEQLGSIFPDDSWQGSASQAYAQQNKDLQDLATKMQELDAKLADVVKDQAAWVTHMRLGLGITKDLLLAAFIVKLFIYAAPPPAGPAAAHTFSVVVSTLGIAVAVAIISDLLARSIQNTQRVSDVALKYGEVAAGAKESSGVESTEKAKLPVAEQSTVSSFEDISVGMPKMSAPPEAPVLTGVASGGSSVVAGTPEIPSTPGFAMPTLAQLTAMSGQGAKLSGQLSQPANLVSQAMGQVQQLASVAQQGQGAATPAKAPAPKEAAPKEAALAGAAPTEAAERAPIEAAAAGAAEAPEPSPAGRVM